jgi:hypothetical protein
MRSKILSGPGHDLIDEIKNKNCENCHLAAKCNHLANEKEIRHVV